MQRVIRIMSLPLALLLGSPLLTNASDQSSKSKINVYLNGWASGVEGIEILVNGQVVGKIDRGTDHTQFDVFLPYSNNYISSKALLPRALTYTDGFKFVAGVAFGSTDGFGSLSKPEEPTRGPESRKILLDGSKAKTHHATVFFVGKNPDIYTKNVPDATSVKDVDVYDGIIDKEVFSEPYETIPGVVRTFTVERTCEHSITSTATGSTEAVVNGSYGNDLVGKVGGEIRGKIEASIGMTLGGKETVSESITIGNSDVSKVKVVWVERYRKGKAKLSDGTNRDFLVRVGLRLKLEKLQ